MDETKNDFKKCGKKMIYANILTINRKKIE